ncbi:MAG: lipopolysaccharide biosynthesis protein [bacterium]
MRDLAEKAVKSVFWIGAAKFFGQLFSWLVTLAWLRLLSPNDFGLMNMALVYEAVIVIVYDLCMGETVIQKKNLTIEDINCAFWFSLTFGLCLCFATWFLAKIIALFFGNQELIHIIRALSIVTFLMAVKGIPNSLLARNLEFKKISLAEFISVVFSNAVSLVMAFMGYGVWSLVMCTLLQNFASCIIILYYSRWKPQLYFSFSRIYNLLRFGIPITGHHLLNYVCQKSDSIIIGKFLGEKSLGYYGVAMDFSRIAIDKVIVIVNKVTYPVFTKVQDSREDLQHYFLKLTYFISIFSLPILLGMSAISEEIFVIVMTPKWLPSLPVFRVFCLLGIAYSYTGVLLTVLKSVGKTRQLFTYSLLCATLLPLAFLATIQYGLLAVALSWLIIYPLEFSYLLYHVLKEVDVSFSRFFKVVSMPLIGSLLMFIFITLIKTALFKDTVSILSMSTYILIGAAFYVLYISIFSRDILDDVKNIIGKVRAKTPLADCSD